MIIIITSRDGRRASTRGRTAGRGAVFTDCTYETRPGDREYFARATLARLTTT